MLQVFICHITMLCLRCATDYSALLSLFTLHAVKIMLNDEQSEGRKSHTLYVIIGCPWYLDEQSCGVVRNLTELCAIVIDAMRVYPASREMWSHGILYRICFRWSDRSKVIPMQCASRVVYCSLSWPCPDPPCGPELCWVSYVLSDLTVFMTGSAALSTDSAVTPPPGAEQAANDSAGSGKAGDVLSTSPSGRLVRTHCRAAGNAVRIVCTVYVCTYRIRRNAVRIVQCMDLCTYRIGGCPIHITNVDGFRGYGRPVYVPSVLGHNWRTSCIFICPLLSPDTAHGGDLLAGVSDPLLAATGADTWVPVSSTHAPQGLTSCSWAASCQR